MQSERVFRQLVLCPLPGLMCTLASSFASERLLFLYSSLSNLGLNLVSLADLDVGQTSNSIFFFLFPLKRLQFCKSRKAHISNSMGTSETERGEVKRNPVLFCKNETFVTLKSLRSLWRELSKMFRQIKSRRKSSLCG